MDDSLPDILARALDMLADAASRPNSPWRNPTLVTIGLDQQPQARTVVVRAFDPGARRLEVHTDRRSRKFAELQVRPQAAIHVWESGSAVQLRLGGTASLHVADEAAHAAWALLPDRSRATYRVTPGPGSVVPDPGALDNSADDADAAAMFCVIRLQVHQLEWLHLAQGSHRRARFCWSGDVVSSMWLVP